MTVFTWNDPSSSPDESSPKDQFNTLWAQPSAVCTFCSNGFKNGQKVWHWHEGGDRDITAHAECVSERGPGLIRDINECMLLQKQAKQSGS